MTRELPPRIHGEDNGRGPGPRRSGLVPCVLRPCRGLPALALAAAILTAGCSSGNQGEAPVFPVKGKISLDGEPAGGAFVVFHPKSPASVSDRDRRPSAQVQPDGSFELTTHSQADGAPAGEYAVTVQWNKLIKQGNDTIAGPNIIPPPYAKPDTTPLEVTIKESSNQLDPFQITRKK